MSPITVTVERNDNAPVLPPTRGFYYVDQGNYQSLKLQPGSGLTIYSDSATSCIVVIAVANTPLGNVVTLAHLDSPACIQAFFSIIAAHGADGATYQVFAQGANPPDNQTSKENADQLRASLTTLGSKVTSAKLFLLEGDPREHNRGQLGLTFKPDGSAVATNQPYTLQLFQRDPSCGGQTVYCIMRRQEQPPVQIRDAGLPFTHAELVELSSIALQFRKNPQDPSTAFTNIVNLQSEEIRQNWSTTPAFEAPWFSDQLKLGAAFAVAMAPVVSLSALHLSQTTPPSFARMRRAVLRLKADQ